MAQALLRAPKVLWEPLTEIQMQNVIASLKMSRCLKAGENNWLLFASIVEAAIWHFTGDVQKSRLKYGLEKIPAMVSWRRHLWRWVSISLGLLQRLRHPSDVDGYFENLLGEEMIGLTAML